MTNDIFGEVTWLDISQLRNLQLVIGVRRDYVCWCKVLAGCCRLLLTVIVISTPPPTSAPLVTPSLATSLWLCEDAQNVIRGQGQTEPNLKHCSRLSISNCSCNCLGEANTLELVVVRTYLGPLWFMMTSLAIT